MMSFVLICAFWATARDYSGVVVNKTDGTPIEGVLVSVDHSEFYARTDQNGRFSITNLTVAVSERPAHKAEPHIARWNLNGRTLDLRSAPMVTSASVYAVNGKRVFNSRIPASRVVGLPGGLATGAYLLELRGEQGALARAQIVLSNQAASSFTFGSAPMSAGAPRLTKSAQAMAVSERLIFRHDEYLPKDSAMTGSNTDMRIELKPDERSFVFDQSKVREYRFTISADSLTYLNTYGYREEFIPAELNFEGNIIGKVGVRYKGSDYTLPRCFFPNGDTTGGNPRKTCAKISYKIKFTQYDPEKRFYGLKKLNLHAFSADATKMREMISYELFRDMGIHAPRTSYANVYVNNVLIGLFLAVEEIDGRFTKSRWPDHGNGNLYKEVWPKSGDTRYYLDGLKTNDDPIESADVRKMVSYYNAISSSNEQNFEQNLSSYMDFDYLLRYLAVDVAIKNWDGIRSWYWDNAKREGKNHNYFFYEEETSNGKIWIVPWDMDQALVERDTYFDAMGGGGFGGGFGGQALPQWNVPTTNCGNQSAGFGGGNTFVPPNCDKLTKLMAAVYWNRYVQLGDLFLNDLFVSQRLNDKINRHSNLITNAVQQDPNINQGTWTNDVNSLKNYLPRNISSFRSYLHP
jgi:spore coat protein CotH